MPALPDQDPRRIVLAAVATAAILPALPAGAQNQIPQELRDQLRATAQTCRADLQRLCPGVRPGGGRILACLESNASAVSPDCSSAIATAQQMRIEASGTLPAP